MTEKEMEKKLAEAWIRKNSGYRQYEHAKKVLCSYPVTAVEYANRVKFITKYLSV